MTQVINLFAGPGAGKSTMAARLFAELKDQGINCELVREFAKELVWANRESELADSAYLRGEQHHRMYLLKDKVDVIITDSPLLLAAAYTKDEYMKRVTYTLFNNFNNINFFINRTKPYNPKGRLQTFEEAKNLDQDILYLLQDFQIAFDEITGDKQGLKKAIDLLEYFWYVD